MFDKIKDILFKIRDYDRLEHDEQTIMETKQCVIAIIEARISEIQGDAQPRPALRAELRELMTKIMEIEI